MSPTHTICKFSGFASPRDNSPGQGFEVAVIRDATAAAKLPEGDGYASAIINFRFMANALWTTEEALKQIESAA